MKMIKYNASDVIVCGRRVYNEEDMRWGKERLKPTN
jgi:hypothetical protein